MQFSYDNCETMTRHQGVHASPLTQTGLALRDEHSFRIAAPGHAGARRAGRDRHGRTAVRLQFVVQRRRDSRRRYRGRRDRFQGHQQRRRRDRHRSRRRCRRAGWRPVHATRRAPLHAGADREGSRPARRRRRRAVVDAPFVPD
ncbi:hypothetical protein F01_260186 [Burkholderia cenocepacia]|nr:hypothetical protein F01_260186 [Burkholderia cenocepacia]